VQRRRLDGSATNLGLYSVIANGTYPTFGFRLTEMVLTGFEYCVICRVRTDYCISVIIIIRRDWVRRPPCDYHSDSTAVG